MLGQQYSLDAVFVASDNPEAQSLLQQLLPHMRVLHNPAGHREFLASGVLGETDLNGTLWSMIEHKLSAAPPRCVLTSLPARRNACACSTVCARSRGVSL